VDSEKMVGVEDDEIYGAAAVSRRSRVVEGCGGLSSVSELMVVE
jgi:hypothetical protein